MDRYIIREHEFIDNIQIIKSRANQVPIWAVVKGNSYGLGLEHTLPLFLSQGIRRFCVSELSEVQTIRSIAGEQVQILMLQPTTEQDTLEHLIDADAICTISSWEDAVALNHTALALGRQAKAHLKIDTGMGRYGFSEPELTQIAKIYQYLEEISILGTYTHFCSSYDKKQTRQQYNRFLAMLKNLRSIGCDPGECHCCNSAAFFLYPEMHMDAVRIGSGWLGRMTAHRRRCNRHSMSNRRPSHSGNQPHFAKGAEHSRTIIKGALICNQRPFSSGTICPAPHHLSKMHDEWH